MAFIIYKDNRRQIVPAAVAEKIWLAKNHEITITPKQAVWCSKIRSVYLNKYGATTPTSYLATLKDHPASQPAMADLFPRDRY